FIGSFLRIRSNSADRNTVTERRRDIRAGPALNPNRKRDRREADENPAYQFACARIRFRGLPDAPAKKGKTQASRTPEKGQGGPPRGRRCRFSGVPRPTSQSHSETRRGDAQIDDDGRLRL